MQKGPVKSAYKYSTIDQNPWSLHKDIAQRLAAFERNVLRECLGGELRKIQIGGSDVIKNQCSCMEI
jgi:hypothetical protein